MADRDPLEWEWALEAGLPVAGVRSSLLEFIRDLS